MWIMISSIFGVLGFILSLINLIYYFISRRVNIEMRIIEITSRPYKNGKERIIVHYQVNNKSNLPISITDMRLIIDDEKYCEDFNTHEVLGYHHTAKGIDEYVPTYNGHLPINLSMLSSRSDYLVFVVPSGTSKVLETALNFEIRTNRQTVMQKTFVLNEWVAIRRILRNGC